MSHPSTGFRPSRLTTIPWLFAAAISSPSLEICSSCRFSFRGFGTGAVPSRMRCIRDAVTESPTARRDAVFSTGASAELGSSLSAPYVATWSRRSDFMRCRAVRRLGHAARTSSSTAAAAPAYPRERSGNMVPSYVQCEAQRLKMSDKIRPVSLRAIIPPLVVSLHCRSVRCMLCVYACVCFE